MVIFIRFLRITDDLIFKKDYRYDKNHPDVRNAYPSRHTSGVDGMNFSKKLKIVLIILYALYHNLIVF